MIKKLLIVIAFGLSLLLLNCNDPANINTGLVDQDRVNVLNLEIDNFTATTVMEDSLVTYTPGGLQTRYPCGKFVDPIFGTTNADIYFQTRFPITLGIVDFEDATYDSLVLTMAYDPVDPLYGDSTQTINYEVFRVTEDMDNAETVYSNQTFETEADPVGAFSLEPDFEDENTPLLFYFSDSTLVDTIAPSIRVKLDDELGMELFDLDSISFTSNTEFLSILKGFKVTATEETNNIASFIFENLTSQRGINFTAGRLTLYYTKDGIGREQNWGIDPTNSTKVLNYEHDYAGSEIEAFIDDPLLGDSLTFMQGFAGVNTKITIDEAALALDFNSGDVIINKAELEVFATILDEEPDLYPLPDQIIVAELVDDQITLVRDFSFATSVGDVSRSGGDQQLVEDNIYRYNVNISTHFQEIVDGDASNEFFLRLFPKPANVRRMALFGPGHSTYPMKLKITYTQL